MTNEELNKIGAVVLDASIAVHRELGPGLLESAYQLALKRELELRGLNVRSKVAVELVYKDVSLGKAYEIDLLVEDEVIIETKAVETLHPIFTFQLITYLKLYHQKKLGYLINFNVQYLKEGFKRIVNNF
ncbi:MAG: GxxExxY protein [Chitinophagaceae bacterium]|nr:MAG: GxxExxY protein [Chitinophagaceae bacterium]